MPRLVTDAADPAVRDYLSLTDVALRSCLEPEHGLFMAESEKVIRRALAAGYRPRSFLLEPRWLTPLADVLADAEGDGVPVLLADQALLTAITGYRVHRGALAAMRRLPLPQPSAVLASARRVAVIEDVVDHTNVGAVFRSAAGLGVDAVLVTPRCADPLYRRSVRVSMGTVLQVPWTRIQPWPAGLDTLRSLGFTIVGLGLPPTAVDLADLAADPPDRIAVILGTEGDGLASRTQARCDVVVRIPMHGGVDSLNVAAAGAVAFWALRCR